MKTSDSFDGVLLVVIMCLVLSAQWWMATEMERVWSVVENSRTRYVAPPKEKPRCWVVLDSVWCIHTHPETGRVSAWQPEMRKGTP